MSSGSSENLLIGSTGDMPTGMLTGSTGDMSTGDMSTVPTTLSSLLATPPAVVYPTVKTDAMPPVVSTYDTSASPMTTMNTPPSTITDINTIPGLTATAPPGTSPSLDDLNSKLDKILSLLDTHVSSNKKSTYNNMRNIIPKKNNSNSKNVNASMNDSMNNSNPMNNSDSMKNSNSMEGGGTRKRRKRNGRRKTR